MIKLTSLDDCSSVIKKNPYFYFFNIYGVLIFMDMIVILRNTSVFEILGYFCSICIIKRQNNGIFPLNQTLILT